MFQFRRLGRRQRTGPAGLVGAAAMLLLAPVMSVSAAAEAPFVFRHPVASQVYETLPIPLRISRKPGTGVPETEAIDVLFEIRQWPHPYGFVSEMWNAILPGKKDHETRVSYFWVTTPGTYSIRARADGFEAHPVEVTFSTTFTLERPLHRIIGPDNRVYRGAKLPLVVDWDPFWATVPHRPYGTLYAEVESWGEDDQAWRPEWKSGNLAGFELPVVLPKQVSIDLEAPGKLTAMRVRVRASFSRKAYPLPSKWHYFCHAPEGKVTVTRPEQGENHKPCLGVSMNAGSAEDP